MTVRMGSASAAIGIPHDLHRRGTSAGSLCSLLLAGGKELEKRTLLAGSRPLLLVLGMVECKGEGQCEVGIQGFAEPVAARSDRSTSQTEDELSSSKC